MVKMAHDLAHGEAVDSLMYKHRVWEKRKSLVKQGLRRHNEKRWLLLLRRASVIDRMIKGQAPGNPWDELLQLGLLMAGVRLFKPVMSPLAAVI
jgi:DNA polymerase-3 subunit delta